MAYRDEDELDDELDSPESAPANPEDPESQFAIPPATEAPAEDDKSDDQRIEQEIAEADALKQEEAAEPVTKSEAAPIVKAVDKKQDEPSTEELDAQDKKVAEDLAKEPEAQIATPTEKPEATEAQKKADMLDMYKQLLAQQRAGMLNAGMLQAGSKIAQAMAMKYGGNPGDNIEGVKMVQDTAKQPVKDYLENQLNQYRAQRANLAGAQAGLATEKNKGLKDLQDAGSDTSKSLQKIALMQWTTAHPNAKPEDVPDFSKIPAAELLKQGVGKSSVANQKVTYKDLMGPDNKVHTYAIDPVTNKPLQDLGVKGLSTRFRVDPTTGNIQGYSGAGYVLPPANAKTPGQPAEMPSSSSAAPTASPSGPLPASEGKSQGPKEITLDDLRNTNNRQADYVQKQADAMAKDTSIRTLRSLGAKENNLAAKLEGFKKDAAGNTVVDAGMAAAIRAQAAALSMGGVPTEGVMHEFGGAGGLDQKLKRLIAGSASGVMTKDDVQFFKRYSDVMRGSLEKSANDNAQLYVTHLVNQFPKGVMSRDNASKLLGVSDLMANTKSTSDLVTIQGPSGQTVKMKKDAADKYLQQPGYQLVQDK